jgi:hypothetical protein
VHIVCMLRPLVCSCTLLSLMRSGIAMNLEHNPVMEPSVWQRVLVTCGGGVCTSCDASELCNYLQDLLHRFNSWPRIP